MDLRQLRYFLTVAEEGHITRAAKRLGIQQPPLSQTIQALEAKIGGKLFLRTPRGVELTSAGEVLLLEARDILGSVDRATALARRAIGGQVGRLAVGFTTSAMMHPVVPKVLRAFRSAHPQVMLDLHEGNAAELTERVHRGEVAVGFLRLPVALPSGMVFERMLEEKLMVVLPNGHQLLAPRADMLTLGDLAKEPFILVRRPNSPGIYSNVLHACRQAGFNPIVAAEVGHMLTNINLVAAGVGISLVPAAMREVNLRQVGYRPIQCAPGLTAPLTVTYLDRGRPPILEAFLGMAREIVAGHEEDHPTNALNVINV